MTREELAKVLMEFSEIEGGQVSVVEENGTISFNGFNQTTFNNFRKSQGLPPKDVRQITVGESLDLIDKEFINRNGIERIPKDVLPLVLDTALNSGPDDAARLFQRTVGSEEDGIIGPNTMKAFNDFEGDFVNDYSDVRRDFLIDSSKPSVDRDREGLLNRVEIIRQRELGKKQASSDVIAQQLDE